MFNILAILFGLLVSPAQAQTCPTRPPGDSSNACASTAFVKSVPFSPSQLPAFIGGDCTSPAGSVVLTCTKTGGVVFAPSATTDATNSTNVKFTQSGTGAVQRTAQSKMQEIFSVLDFGADKTGVANSKSAFQAAFDAASVLGGTVYIPDGTYLISGGTASVLTGGNVHIKGASPGGVLIVNGNTNAPAIRFGDNVSLRYGNAISNLSCAQKSGVTPVLGNACLAIYAQGQFKMDHITVTSYPAAVYDGILAYGVSTGTLHDIWVQNTLNHGITLGSTQIGGNTLWSSDLYATAMRSDANGAAGFNMFDVQGLYAANWSAYGNGTNGCSFSHGPYSDSFNGNNFLLNVICDTSGSDNFYISDLRDSTFTNVWASTQKSTLVNTTASGFVLTTNRVQNVSFNNSFALLNNGFGVNIYDPTGVTGSNSPINLRFNNFVFGSTAGSLAHGNGVGGFGYGLLANGVSDVYVLGGIFQGNASGPYNVTAGNKLVIRTAYGVVDAGATTGAPTISSCGTSPSVTAGASNDSGQITTGSTATTACTITFATAFPNTASCTVVPVGAANSGLYISAQSAAAFTITYTSATSQKFQYNCKGT